ncbi:uncharacterized protein LOC111015948 isoform X2 [Momordica charantia]|uniref:ADP,ATP carrier protein n=1 Tax=Momordica charantia TaxID=3673 RepID=A0A6J1D0Q5_MOMCH|nr:uncharacterized protein LOC111015948 isoform X2 [Momordica charantia]
MMSIISKSRLDPIVSAIVTVHPHEISALLHSAFCFFFILSAYFVVLPLRDEGAISLGLMNLPSLFVGSLVLTLIAAPVSSHIFSLPNLSKGKALVLIHRFFSASLVVFFILWQSSSTGFSKGFFTMFSTAKEDQKDYSDESSSVTSRRVGSVLNLIGESNTLLLLKVALLNLITISSTWARIIDVMDSESGSRLFGFIGAGATLGQLFGSLFATAMAWLGPYLLLFAALLMEFAARLSEGINPDMPRLGEELSLIRDADHSQEKDDEGTSTLKGHSPKSTSNPHPWAIFDGMMLILSSSYLTGVALFLWLSAVISSFFYLQKVSIIAITVTSSLGRRKLFALINSFIAVFILAGQLTVTGHILTIAGVTIAICAAPSVAFLNLVAIAVWPTWVAIAVCETLRKVTTYVVTRPGRELLFTVVSQDEKYKAKICIDVFVQRLGDATAAGMYKLLLSTLHGKTSTISLYALPICLLWIVTAFYLGRRQSHLAQLQMLSMS